MHMLMGLGAREGGRRQQEEESSLRQLFDTTAHPTLPVGADGVCRVAPGYTDFAAMRRRTGGSGFLPKLLLSTVFYLLDPRECASQGVGGDRCTDSAATNYSPLAAVDDGSCTYECGAIQQRVGAPANAECFLYSDTAWDSLLTGKAADGVLTVDGAWVVQGKPLQGSTKLAVTAPGFPYRFEMDSGTDLTLRFAHLQSTGGANINKGGGLMVTGGKAQLVGVYFSKGASTSQLGGAIYAAGGSDVRVTLAVFEESSALTGGAIWAEDSKIRFTNCTFDHTKSLSHGGGGIYAKGCDPVEITDTLFDGCKAEDPDHGGDALDLEGCNNILITGTEFEPFVASRTVFFDTSCDGSPEDCSGNDSCQIQNLDELCEDFDDLDPASPGYCDEPCIKEALDCQEYHPWQLHTIQLAWS